MQERRHGPQCVCEGLRAERACDVPVVAERILDEAGALSVRTIGRFAQRLAAGRKRLCINRVDVVDEHMERHRPARHDLTGRAFTEHEHGIADAQFAMRPVSAALGHARFHGVEHANEEVSKTSIRHPRMV